MGNRQHCTLCNKSVDTSFIVNKSGECFVCVMTRKRDYLAEELERVFDGSRQFEPAMA